MLWEFLQNKKKRFSEESSFKTCKNERAIMWAEKKYGAVDHEISL